MRGGLLRAIEEALLRPAVSLGVVERLARLGIAILLPVKQSLAPVPDLSSKRSEGPRLVYVAIFLREIAVHGVYRGEAAERIEPCRLHLRDRPVLRMPTIGPTHRFRAATSCGSGPLCRLLRGLLKRVVGREVPYALVG